VDYLKDRAGMMQQRADHLDQWKSGTNNIVSIKPEATA